MPSRNPSQWVIDVSGNTLQQVEKFKKHLGVIHEWRKVEQGVWYMDW